MTLPRYLEDDDEPTVPVAAHCASEIDDAQPQRPDEWGDAVIALVRASPLCEFVIETEDATAPTQVERTVVLRISATIDNEYANRLPDFLPLAKLSTGDCTLTLEEAKAVLADAAFNSDREAVDVGPYGVPLKAFNAYAALAKQARAVIAAAEAA